MLSISNKALLLELAAYVADNNIRRGVLTTATHTMSTDGVLNDRSLIVKPGLDAPINIECVADNKTTVFKCTGGPLTVNARIGNNVQLIEFEVSSIWVMSTEVKEIKVKNPGERQVQLRIIQV